MGQEIALVSATPGRLRTRVGAAQVAQVLARDPVANVFVAARLAENLRPKPTLWGYETAGEVSALCFCAANMVPVEADSAALHTFAERAAQRGRTCSSILGPMAQVRELWRLLNPFWGPAREVRASQPLLVTTTNPEVASDPNVRLAVATDLPALEPAAVAMYTEEVGVNPLIQDGGTALRRRLEHLVSNQRVYVRLEHGQVIFKAEIGSVALGVCQVQGVWVHPNWRGRGLGAGGMATVTIDALRRIAGTVSLYVNDYNAPARAIYRRCGYRQVGEFATVLF
ncbi:MAG: GNAT family N-acetyltransferase [Corynebacteriales bacterium]|nr:GNAT family N-acetyltransferase [Mycobacteriales bacterium]